MKIAFQCKVLKNFFYQCSVFNNTCHSQHVSNFPLFRELCDVLRLKRPNFHCSNYSSIETEKLLTRPEVQNYLRLINTEYGNPENSIDRHNPICGLLDQIRKYENDIKNLRTLSSDNDKDMAKLIQAEEEHYRNKIKDINSELVLYAMPREDDDKNVTLEVSSGIGGQEAKLFAEELFAMYMKYAIFRNWEVSFIDMSPSYGGGINKAEACFSGQMVFRLLRHEAGIHRVQRIPKTEKAGRTQTSTCKVNVIPDIEENEIVLRDKDLKVETKTSSGPGGQNVNKCETCVRITYLPTGITVECQSQRSQTENKRLALKKLRQILYQQEQERNLAKVSEIKKEQATTVERSDKIKTYNFLQNRVTDHRINHTMHNLDKYFDGNKVLDDMIMLAEKNYREEYLLRNINRILRERNVQELFKLKATR